MIEDKLTQEQRLRLECLAQANAGYAGAAKTEKIVSRASAFENYVRTGEVPDAGEGN